jgi:thymidylate synthase (FAD)
MRHRIGSFNEVSTRYVEMQPEFYIPTPGLWRRQVGKPGHYTMEPITDGTEHALSVEYEKVVEAAYAGYKRLLEMGLAKEVARNVLPLALFTTFIWSVNLRSCYNFMSLRTAPNALAEIQIPARMVEDLCYIQVPNAMDAWVANDRVSP